jgi:hypothetical protein
VTTSIVAPQVETDDTPISTRFIEVRVVVPIDEAGNVREEFAMKLPAEWLADLPAILRRLPDDRYRLYLMLEDGNEQRLIMDVLVRGGRPYEPTEEVESATGSAVPATMPSPIPSPPAAQPPNLLPPNLPPTNLQPPQLQPPEEVPARANPALPPADQRGSWNRSLGLGLAAAALVASRQNTSQWTDEVDAVAADIAKRPKSVGWRLWRLANRWPASSHKDVV